LGTLDADLSAVVRGDGDYKVTELLGAMTVGRP
jgi:hypothetical protein